MISLRVSSSGCHAMIKVDKTFRHAGDWLCFLFSRPQISSSNSWCLIQTIRRSWPRTIEVDCHLLHAWCVAARDWVLTQNRLYIVEVEDNPVMHQETHGIVSKTTPVKHKAHQVHTTNTTKPVPVPLVWNSKLSYWHSKLCLCFFLRAYLKKIHHGLT